MYTNRSRLSGSPQLKPALSIQTQLKPEPSPKISPTSPTSPEARYYVDVTGRRYKAQHMPTDKRVLNLLLRIGYDGRISAQPRTMDPTSPRTRGRDLLIDGLELTPGHSFSKKLDNMSERVGSDSCLFQAATGIRAGGRHKDENLKNVTPYVAGRLEKLRTSLNGLDLQRHDTRIISHHEWIFGPRYNDFLTEMRGSYRIKPGTLKNKEYEDAPAKTLPAAYGGENFVEFPSEGHASKLQRQDLRKIRDGNGTLTPGGAYQLNLQGDKQFPQGRTGENRHKSDAEIMIIHEILSDPNYVAPPWLAEFGLEPTPPGSPRHQSPIIPKDSVTPFSLDNALGSTSSSASNMQPHTKGPAGHAPKIPPKNETPDSYRKAFDERYGDGLPEDADDDIKAFAAANGVAPEVMKRVLEFDDSDFPQKGREASEGPLNKRAKQ